MHKDLGDRRKERGKDTKGRRKKGGETWERNAYQNAYSYH